MEMAGIVRRNVVFLLVSAMAMGVAPAWGDPFIIGIASVIDGDTLEIRGQRIRLHGIDAPESGQLCEKDGKQYRCGQQAALILSDKIRRATIRCEQRDIDRYERIVAVCQLGDVDLNAWMVQEGWAIAYRQYSRDYIDEENTARIGGVGIWAGRFIAPSRWRRGERLAMKKAEHLTAGKRPIRSNINRSAAAGRLPRADLLASGRHGQGPRCRAGPTRRRVFDA